jgi:hypothetical protein
MPVLPVTMALISMGKIFGFLIFEFTDFAATTAAGY